MTTKEKYEMIDKSKVGEKLLTILQNMEKSSKNFTDESVNSKIDTALDKIIEGFRASKPEALRTVTEAKKEVKKEKEKAIKKNEGKDFSDKKDTDDKTGLPKKDTVEERKDIIKKESESEKEAKDRAKKELDKEKDKAKEEIESQIDKLNRLILEDPALQGFNTGTAASGGGKSTPLIDAERKALPRGSRVSKKGWKNQYGKSEGGRKYWENRENRSDRKSPEYNTGKPYLEKGGNVYSSDDMYEVKMVQDGIELDSKLIRARNKGEAREIFEDWYEEKYRDEFGDFELEIMLAESKMADGGYMADGGMVKNINEDIANINVRLKKLEEINSEDAYRESSMLRKQKASLQALLLHYNDEPQNTEFLYKGRQHYAKGGYMADGGKVSYDFEWRDEEGDTYEASFDTLEDAKEEIRKIREEGGRITETWKYVDGEFSGRFENGGKIKVGDTIFKAWFKNPENSSEKFHKVYVNAKTKVEAENKAKLIDAENFDHVSTPEQIFAKYQIKDIKSDNTPIYDEGGKVFDDDGNEVNFKVGDKVVHYRKMNPTDSKKEHGGEGVIIAINDAMGKVLFELTNYEQWYPLKDLKKSVKYAKGGYMAKGENYEYINNFTRFDSNVPVDDDDFEKFVDAYHKKLSGDRWDEIKYELLKERMGNYLGRKTMDEMEAYVEKTHQAHNKMADGGDVIHFVAIPEYMKEVIAKGVNMGYDTIVEGMITPKKRGIMIINDDYKVRGTFNMELKDAIQNIIDKVKSGEIKVEKEYADGGDIDDERTQRFDNIRNAFDLLDIKVKSRIVEAVGIDNAVQHLFGDYSISPLNLITGAVRSGLLELDEINQDLFWSAIMEAERVTEDYRDSGQGIGGSDITYFTKEMLDDAGFKTGFVNNRLERLDDNGNVLQINKYKMDY